MTSSMESTLKLTIEKGPREGETLEVTSSHRSTIRIGRVVRGNTLAIKDVGISSKHICIKFNNSWLLSDLDSSNGTFLNDVLLSPTEPAEIMDGDTIKLGEVTSIKVRIESSGENQVRMNLGKGGGKVETDVMESGKGYGEEEKNKAVGKPPRRGRPKKVLHSNEIADKPYDAVAKVEEMDLMESGIGDGEEEKNKAVGKPPRRGRPKKVLHSNEIADKPYDAVVKDEEMSIMAPVSRPIRSTRNSKKAENVDLGMNESNLKELEKAVPAKRGGRRKRILQDDSVSENLDKERTELPGMVENLGHVNIEKNFLMKENLEAGKSVNLGEECGLDKDYSVNLPSEAVEMRIAAPVSRQTKSTRNSNNAENSGLNMNEINLKEPQRAQQGGRRKIISQNDPELENLEKECTELPVRVENLGHESIEKNSTLKDILEARKSVNLGEECGQDKENLPSKAAEMDVSGEDGERTSNIRQEDAEELATSSGVKENSDDISESPDLKNMTLGDWFDYFEVALPKEIHDEAEEMILDMRKKAAQFQEFMLQQMNAKA